MCTVKNGDVHYLELTSWQERKAKTKALCMDKSRTKSHNLRDKLSQWETYLAPLSEQQKDSYLQLSAAATTRPMPPQVRLQTLGLTWALIQC